MKRHLTILFIIVVYNLSIGQNTSRLDSLFNADSNDRKCAFHSSGLNISSTFPFNVTDRVELVSFSDRNSDLDSIVANKKLLLTTIKQRKDISKKEIDTLFDKIYNYRSYSDIKTNMLSVSNPSCYIPHHAIIFYKDKSPIAFIEICFKCSTYKMSDSVEWFGECTEKYEYFRALFKKYGLTYMLK